jgi:hypothetical protein
MARYLKRIRFRKPNSSELWLQLFDATLPEGHLEGLAANSCVLGTAQHPDEVRSHLRLDAFSELNAKRRIIIAKPPAGQCICAPLSIQRQFAEGRQIGA